MKIRHSVVVGIVLAVLYLGFGIVRAPQGPAGPQADHRVPPNLALRRLPMSFEELGGGSPAGFVGRGMDISLFLQPTEAILVPNASASGAPETLEIAFQGADPEARMRAEEKLTGVSNYFVGSDPTAWRTGVPHYARVHVFDIYPNIDLVYYGNQEELEFDLIVAPGGDPSWIVMGLKGAEEFTVDARGDLLASLGGGEIKLRRPVVYQGSREDPQGVDSRFVLLGNDLVGFELGAYDRGRPLVVDPSITYATYFGSAGPEFSDFVDVDSAGNVYVQGMTQATNFPMANALYPTYGGGSFDVFVVKINPMGDTLLFSTYFGGNGRDNCGGIAVDADGDIYLAGSTDSLNFPLVSPLQPEHGGGNMGYFDAFLTKMRSDGSALIYSTYLGGNGDEVSYGLGVDADKSAYVMGTTYSTNFPTANAFQATNHGFQDMFVSKVNAAGSAFVYSTYLGGSGYDTSDNPGNGGLAVNSSGYAAVVGYSTSVDFPVVNAFQATFKGPSSSWCGDGVVTKFDPTGSVVFSTYLGGSSDEMAEAVAIGESGTVFVTGRTMSTDFPTQNAYQGSYGGGARDAFLSAFNPDGTVLYSTYLGGNANEQGQAVTDNGLGNAYVAGATKSSDFPLVDPVDGICSVGGDAFITVFAADGMSLGFSTFLGGAGGAGAQGISLDPDGNIYVLGGAGVGFPTTAGSYMPDPPGANGGLFLAKIEGVSFIPGPVLTSLVPSSASAGDPGFLLSVVGEGFVDGAVVRWDGSDRPTTFVSISEVQATIPASDLTTGKTVQITVRNPDTGISNALPFTINNPVPTLASISPTTTSAGCAAFTLTVVGTDFVLNSVVHWNGVAKATTFVSGTELQAAIDATCLATPGEVQVTVVNPAPAGGASSAASFSLAGYTVASDPASVTVSAGQSATYTVNLTPQYGSFDASVTFSCEGLPNKCAATFAPASVTPGAAAATTTLTLATRASATTTAAALSGTAAMVPPSSGLALLVLGLVLAPRLSHVFGRRISRRWAAACALLVLVVFIGGCSSGGGGDNNQTYTGTPKGTHTITVRAVSGNLMVTSTITLVVN